MQPIKVELPDWPQLVNRIIREGAHSEAEIAELIGVKQSTVNRIRHGHRKSGPKYAEAARLIALYRRYDDNVPMQH